MTLKIVKLRKSSESTIDASSELSTTVSSKQKETSISLTNNL